MIDFEKFTNYSQEILYASSVKMNEYKNTQIQPEHIMLAMIKDDGIIKDYLTELKLLKLFEHWMLPVRRLKKLAL